MQDGKGGRPKAWLTKRQVRIMTMLARKISLNKIMTILDATRSEVIEVKHRTGFSLTKKDRAGMADIAAWTRIKKPHKKTKGIRSEDLLEIINFLQGKDKVALMDIHAHMHKKSGISLGAVSAKLSALKHKYERVENIATGYWRLREQ